MIHCPECSWGSVSAGKVLSLCVRWPQATALHALLCSCSSDFSGCLRRDSVPGSLSRLREVVAWLFQDCCRLRYRCIRPHCNPNNRNSAWCAPLNLLMCCSQLANISIEFAFTLMCFQMKWNLSQAGRGWRTQDDKCRVHVCTSYLGWWNGASITIGGCNGQWEDLMEAVEEGRRTLSPANESGE